MRRDNTIGKWSLWAASLTLAGGLPALGCGGGSSGAPADLVEVTMGATISRTGVSAVATWGDAFHLAAGDMTEGIASAGYPFHVSYKEYVEDSMNMSAVAAAKAVELVQTKNIKMVLNGTSGDSLAINALMYDDDTTNDINIPVVCVACSSTKHHNPEATDAVAANQAAYRNEGRWHFGLSMSSLPQSVVLSRILLAREGKNGDLNGDGKVKVSIVNIDDPFGTTFADALRATLLASRPDAIIEQISHPRTAPLDTYDWTGVLASLTDDQTGGVGDARPDAIVEITFPQFSLALVKAYAAGAYTVPFFHTHSMREQPVVLQAGHDLDNQEGTSYLPSDGASGAAFDAHFSAVAHLNRQSQWDAHVYDGAFIFGLGTLVAAKAAGGDASALTGAQIRDGMLAVNDPAGEVIRPGADQFAKAAKLIADGKAVNYEGASGPCDFDPYGRALNRISQWRASNQVVSNMATFDCVQSPSQCPLVAP